MKHLILTSVMIFGISGLLRAADVEVIKSEATVKSSNSANTLAESTSSKPRAHLKPIDPQETGAFTAIAQKGWVMISPFAPASEGYGEHYLVDNPFPNQQTSRRSSNNASQYGGIKLFGWDF